MLKLTRKGQLEIMGLVLVVVLVSLGMLFLLKFVVFKPVGEERATFTRSQLATNTLDALIKTETECEGRTIEELINDCIGFQQYDDCNGLGSCNFLDEKISFIFEETLVKWQKHYNFQVSKSQVTMITIDDGWGCPGERDSHYQPLPGAILIRLDVCD